MGARDTARADSIMEEDSKTLSIKEEDSDETGDADVRGMDIKEEDSDETGDAVTSEYDKDQDGLLSRKIIFPYSHPELNFKVTEANLDHIFKVLVSDGSKKVKETDLPCLKAFVDVAREMARDQAHKQHRQSQVKLARPNAAHPPVPWGPWRTTAARASYSSGICRRMLVWRSWHLSSAIMAGCKVFAL